MKKYSYAYFLLIILGLAIIIVIVFIPKIITIMPLEFSDNRPGDLWPCKIYKVDLNNYPHHEKIPSLIYSFSVNKLGFRGPEVAITKDTKIIIVLGDGYAFGSGLNSGETISERLNMKLEGYYGKEKFAVLNAGMPGYTLTDEFDYMAEKGIKLKPSVVVLVITNSDPWEMLREKTMREKMKTRTHSRWLIVKSLFIKQKGYDSHLDSESNPKKDEISVVAFNKYTALFKQFTNMVRSYGGSILVVLEADQWPGLWSFLKNEDISFVDTKQLIPYKRSFLSVKDYLAAQAQNPDLANWYLIDGHFGRKTADLVAEQLLKLITISRQSA